MHTMVPRRWLLPSPSLPSHPFPSSSGCSQLGGSDPETLAAAVKKVAEYGYDEINLNCGCPRWNTGVVTRGKGSSLSGQSDVALTAHSPLSDRVAGAGCFGASLMLQPELVAACMKAMGEASGGIPVTVKCR